MNFIPYPFESAPNGLVYAFNSVSDQRTIQKFVIFTQLSSNQYNLALVDLDENDELSDTTVSDNKDMEQVLSTVIRILLTFLKQHIGSEVIFTGSTPARTRLYRIIINKYALDVQGSIKLEGIRPDRQREDFQANQPYISFVLSLM